MALCREESAEPSKLFSLLKQPPSVIEINMIKLNPETKAISSVDDVKASPLTSQSDQDRKKSNSVDGHSPTTLVPDLKLVQDDSKSSSKSTPSPFHTRSRRRIFTRSSLLANTNDVDATDSNTHVTPEAPCTKRRKTGKSQWCSALNCKNSRTKNRISFFRFPLDEERSKLWVLNCRRADLLTKTAKELFVSNVLCQQHFELDQFKNPNKNRLATGAVPTLFDFGSGLPLPPPTCEIPETETPALARKKRPLTKSGVDTESKNIVKKLKKGRPRRTDSKAINVKKGLSTTTRTGKGRREKLALVNPVVKKEKWLAKHGPGLSKEHIDTNFHSPKDIEKEYLFNCLHSALAVRFGKGSDGKGGPRSIEYISGQDIVTAENLYTSYGVSVTDNSNKPIVKTETSDSHSSVVKTDRKSAAVIFKTESVLQTEDTHMIQEN